MCSEPKNLKRRHTHYTHCTTVTFQQAKKANEIVWDLLRVSFKRSRNLAFLNFFLQIAKYELAFVSH